MEDFNKYDFFDLKGIDNEKIRKYVLNALFGEFATNKSLFNRIMGTVGKPIVFKEDTNEILKNHWFYKYICSDYFRAELFYKKEKGRYFLCKRELIGGIILSINTSLTTNKALKEKRFYSSEHKNIKKEIQKDIKIIEDFRDLFFNKLKLSNNDKSIDIVFNEDNENLSFLNDNSLFEYKNINALFDKLIGNLSKLNGNLKKAPFIDYRYNFHSVYYSHRIEDLKREINKMVCMHYSFEDYKTFDFSYDIGLLIEFLQENKNL